MMNQGIKTDEEYETYLYLIGLMIAFISDVRDYILYIPLLYTDRNVYIIIKWSI